MSIFRTNTPLAARSNNIRGFRVSGTILDIQHNMTNDGRPSVEVTFDKITTIRGSVLKQTIARAIGDDVAIIAPPSAKIGDTVKFFGAILPTLASKTNMDGKLLVLGPWTR